MTGGVASLLKANGVEWVKGTGRFTSPTTIAVEGAEDVTFKSAIVATGSYPMRPPIPGLDSPRCVDSTGLLSQTEVPRRLVVLGGGIIGCEFASIFAHFGSEVTIIEMLPTLIPQEDADAAKELQKAFKKRGITVLLEKQCTGVEDTGEQLIVRYGDGESVEADLMLVSVGRAPLVQGLGLDEIGVPTDPRAGIATDDHMRTAIPTIFAAGDVAGRWQLAHTAFREGEIAAENAMGHDSALGTPAVPRPIYTDPEIAGVGLTEAQAREQYGDAVAVGSFPWVANARAVMSGTTSRVGEVDPRDDLRRAARPRHRRAARDRSDRGRRRRDRLGVDGRDRRRRHRAPSDVVGGDQGGRSRGTRTSDPSSPQAPLMLGSESSRRNAVAMSIGWWYLRRLIRKRGTAAVDRLPRRRGPVVPRAAQAAHAPLAGARRR